MDLRIEYLFNKEFKNDTSFTEKPTTLERIFGRATYKQTEVREIWKQGIKVGLERGLFLASLEGQRIELNHNTPDGKHKEFLEKFYQLAAEYKCAVQYHPEVGMVVVARQNGYNGTQMGAVRI